MKKYIALFIVVNMVLFAQAQDQVSTAHIKSRYPGYAPDYVAQKTTTKTLREKDLPVKQQYVQVITKEDGTATFEEYSFMVGEKLLYFKDGYYYSSTTGALLAPVPGTKKEDAAETKGEPKISTEQKIQLGMVILDKVIQVHQTNQMRKYGYGAYGAGAFGGQAILPYPGPQINPITGGMSF